MKIFRDNDNTSIIHNQEIMFTDVKNKINEESVKIQKIEYYMEKLEKALDNYVKKAIIDYKQKNYNRNIEYRNKITEKFNKIDGELKVFNEAFKKIYFRAN